MSSFHLNKGFRLPETKETVVLFTVANRPVRKKQNFHHELENRFIEFAKKHWATDGKVWRIFNSPDLSGLINAVYKIKFFFVQNPWVACKRESFAYAVRL